MVVTCVYRRAHQELEEKVLYFTAGRGLPGIQDQTGAWAGGPPQ